MEEYLIAADRVAASNFDAYLQWDAIAFALRSGQELDDKLKSQVHRSPIGDPLKTTILSARREIAQELHDVREIVRAGNSKPVHSIHPNPQYETSYPELASFKRLAKFLITDAFVAFANGNSNSGTDALVVGISMCNRLPQDNQLCRLVTVMLNGIYLSSFEQHLQRFSAPDVDRIAKALKELPTWEAGLSVALKGERQRRDSMLRGVESDRSQALDYVTNRAGLSEFLKKVSSAEWTQLISIVRNRVESQQEIMQAILQGPENSWFSELKAQGIDVQPQLNSTKEETGPKSIEEAANEFSDTLGIAMQFAEAEARYRTQLRLLRLHMRVLSYRWREGRMPTKLEQAAPASEIQDTFGGGDFQFQSDPYGNYHLYSNGFRNSGRIDLRYRPYLYANQRQASPDDPPQ